MTQVSKHLRVVICCCFMSLIFFSWRPSQCSNCTLYKSWLTQHKKSWCCSRIVWSATRSLAECAQSVMATLMDNIMENVSGKEWHYESLALPQVGHMSLPDIAEPITLEEFLQAACHRCDNVKSTATLFDVHSKVSCSGIPSRQDDVNKDRSAFNVLDW